MIKLFDENTADTHGQVRLTSCSKSANKPSTSCFRTISLEQVVNKLQQRC
jgi:hypothetical protein